jgi:hypothetical protein
MNGIFIACILVALTNPAIAESGIKPRIRGLTYSLARKILVQRENTPVAVHADRDRFCVGAEDVCEAYPETENCAGTGERPCIFMWQTKSGRNFEVFTIGEELTDMTVTGVEDISSPGRK